MLHLIFPNVKAILKLENLKLTPYIHEDTFAGICFTHNAKHYLLVCNF